MEEETEESNWGLVYFDRYVKLFGNPIDNQVLEKEGYPSLQILTFAPSNDFMVFATIGLTLYEHEFGGAYEVFIGTDDRPKEVKTIFGFMMTTIIEKTIKPEIGLTLPDLDKVIPEFSKATGKNTLYMTNSTGLDNLGVVHLTDHEHGRILTTFFISQAEADYLEKEDVDKFENALQEAGIDPTDINRKSIF